MSDHHLRRLERRHAQGEDVVEQLRRERERNGIAVRSPIRFPLPGDVVEAPAGGARRSPIARRIVDCAEFKACAIGIVRRFPGCGSPWTLSWAFDECRNGVCNARIHWVRHKGRGARFGLLLRPSWRAWAKGATVLKAGAL